VWTDVQQSSTEDVFTPLYHARSEEEFRRSRRRWREHHPYFAFNTQRIDLIVS
jgi:hypothetical protein